MANTPRQRIPIGVLIRTGVSLGLLSWFVFALDLHEVVARFSKLRLGLYAIVFAIALLDRVLCVWRWSVLLRAKNIHIDFGPLFRVQMISTFLGSFLPTSFAPDILRIVAISRHTVRPIEAISASTVDRVVMVFVTILVALLTSAMAVGRYLLHNVVVTVGVILAVLTLALVAMAWTKFTDFITTPLRYFGGEHIAIRVASVFKEIQDYRRYPGTLVAAGALALLTIVVRLVLLYVTAHAIGSDVSLAAVALVMPTAWAALMLPVSVGGLGLQEGVFIVAFGLIGVDAPAAVTISILLHVLTRAVALPGLYWYALSGLRPVVESRS